MNSVWDELNQVSDFADGADTLEDKILDFLSNAVDAQKAINSQLDRINDIDTMIGDSIAILNSINSEDSDNVTSEIKRAIELLSNARKETY